MKKVILIIALAATSTVVFSQAKIDTAKKQTPAAVKPVEKPKPQFQLDMNQPAQVVMTLADFTAVLRSPEDWKGIEEDAQISGKQIKELKNLAGDARVRMRDQLNNIVAQMQKNFQDTVGKPQIIAPPKKGK